MIPRNGSNWDPPDSWQRVTAIESHTGGEPFRVVVDGVGPIPGETVLAKRRWAQEHLDGLRKSLMWEPRGHSDMYGCFIDGPTTPTNDISVLFMHNEGFSTMCGHGIIALTKVALDTGILPIQGDKTVVGIDSPAGSISAVATVVDEAVDSVKFTNVPSFVAQLDARVDVPELGQVQYDLAFGGAFYAYVDARDIGLECTPEHVPDLISHGKRIKKAVSDAAPIDHPFEADLGFLYGVIFVDKAHDSTHHSRNVCVFAEGEVDRSPTGTGVSGRLAIHHARGDIAAGDSLTIESVAGSTFTGTIAETTNFGPYQAVIPDIEGTANILGKSEFWIDPSDSLGKGFLLR
jgi:trans-L-3-hydroxyproline dehydratase